MKARALRPRTATLVVPAMDAAIIRALYAMRGLPEGREHVLYFVVLMARWQQPAIYRRLMQRPDVRAWVRSRAARQGIHTKRRRAAERQRAAELQGGAK